MKYQFGKCTSCQIGGIVRKKSDKIIFDTDSPKWKGLKGEIHAAFEAGYLEMTKESAKKFKAENEKSFKAAKEKKAKLEDEKLEAEIKAEEAEAKKK